MAFSTQKIFFHVPFMNETYRFECKNPCVKLKRYASSSDERAWSANDTRKSKFLVDLVACHTPIVRPLDTSNRSRNRGNKGRGQAGEAKNVEPKRSRKSPNSSGRRARVESVSRPSSSRNLAKGRGGYEGPGSGQKGHGHSGRRYSRPNQGYGNRGIQRKRSYGGPDPESQLRGGRGSISNQPWSHANPYPRLDQGGYGNPVPEQSGDQEGYEGQGQELKYPKNQENFYSLKTDQDQGHGGYRGPGWTEYNGWNQSPGQYERQESYGDSDQESLGPGRQANATSGQYSNGYGHSVQQSYGHCPYCESDEFNLRYEDENTEGRGQNVGGPEQGDRWYNCEYAGQQDQWHNARGGQGVGQRYDAYTAPYQNNDEWWANNVDQKQ